MAELLFLRHLFKEKVWGGNRINEHFSYGLQEENVGEGWMISAHPQGVNIIESGEFAQERLDWLWTEHPELFGNEDGRYGDQFPLLVKIIDAKEDLSIQVHPDDAYAKIHENGSLGKTECWYILDCEPGASIIIGHQAGSRQEMRKMIEHGQWQDFVREIPIKKGDFFQIPPGCVHAIKGGTLLLETQQSSDVTYRLYDYGRLADGKPRELHLSQGMEVISVPWEQEKNQRANYCTEAVDKEHLQTCGYYTVEHYRVHGVWGHYFPHGFTNVSVIEGEGQVNGIPVKKGMNFIIPSGYGACLFEGNFEMVCSWPETQGNKNSRPEEVSAGNGGICLEVLDWMGRRKAWVKEEHQAVLAFEDIYEEGDAIRLTVPEINRYYVVRIDGAMDEALVFLSDEVLDFSVPFGEKKKSYHPLSFSGIRHYLTCRRAEEYEWKPYRNLAKNVMDQHGNTGCYPHASANVETRNESVFAARNAIDGIVANRSHGSWPYESWGINRRDDAELLLEFGCLVNFDRIVLWTRADFPHDNWWNQVTFEFSDGTQETVELEKRREAHQLRIEKSGISWIKLKNMKKSADPSPFPALTQIEVYGTPAV